MERQGDREMQRRDRNIERQEEILRDKEKERQTD
jgi:hypothetical protein